MYLEVNTDNTIFRGLTEDGRAYLRYPNTKTRMLLSENEVFILEVLQSVCTIRNMNTEEGFDIEQAVKAVMYRYGTAEEEV